ELHEVGAEQPAAGLTAVAQDALEVLAIDEAFAEQIAADAELRLLHVAEGQRDRSVFQADGHRTPGAGALLDLEHAGLALVDEQLEHVAEGQVLDASLERVLAVAARDEGRELVDEREELRGIEALREAGDAGLAEGLGQSLGDRPGGG